MAAPSYTTDLNDISTCESTTNFDESSNAAWDDGGAVTQESDYYIQNSYCISQALKTGRGTIIYDYGSGITWSSGDVLMAWLYCIGPTAMADYSAGGFGFVIGSSLGDFYNWDVWGKDYYIYGGWICVPLDPTETADDTVGSPAAWSSLTKQFWGMSANITGNINKGNTIGIDAIRYGRAEAKFKDGDASNGYCTFSGFAAQNDSGSNRWGLIQEVAGGYLWQGLMSLGESASNGDAVDFRDSNKLIFINQQLKVYASFNRIEVNQSDSRVDWTNIVFVSTGGKSLGQLEVMDNADVNIDACSFIGMDTFVFLANSTVENTNFVGCGQVTQGGGTFTGCTFDEGTDDVALVVANSVANVTNSEFVSPGTPSGGHYGLEGFSTGGSYNLTGLTFTGFASSDGSTGYEAIHVLATSGTVTLNISGGSTPSVHSEGATISKVISPVTLTVTCKTATGVDVNNARVILRAYEDSATGAGPFPYEDTVTIVNSDPSAGPIATVSHTGHGMATNDYVEIKGASIQDNNGVKQITVINANSYSYDMTSYPGSNPTGTITCTFVALYGLTASGQVSASRSYSADQAVEGHARKSSATPFYKTAPLVGTVDASDGYTATAVMILDE